MANADRPNGFRPAKNHPYFPPTRHSAAASQTIAVGDAVFLNSSGLVEIAIVTSGSLLGVAATKVAASASGDDIFVYDNPDQVFEGQTSGTITRAQLNTSQSSPVDIEGTTGIMEVNEDATTEAIIRLIGLGTDPVTHETTEVGLNSRVLFKIAKHNANGDVTA